MMLLLMQVARTRPRLILMQVARTRPRLMLMQFFALLRIVGDIEEEGSRLLMLRGPHS